MVSNLPCDLVAERAILSILLVEPERFLEVSDKLEIADFFDSTHQDIWQAMYTVYRQGLDLDLVTIRSELTKQQVDAKPAMTELTLCLEEGALSVNLDNFIKMVKNKSVLRRLVFLSSNYLQLAQLQDSEAELLLSRYERDLIDVAETVKEERPYDAGGILNEIRADMVAGQENRWKGYSTGFSSLDNPTGGFLPTHCWIVGAYTGGGKTFLLLQFILNVLEQGGKVVLFSTEMDRKMNMLRLLGNLADLGTLKILKGQLTDIEKERMTEAEKKLNNFKKNLTIYDNIYTLEEIRLKAKKKKLREGLDLLVVDFIQNLRGAEDIYTRMSTAAIGLQQLAQELKTTVLIASQVTQEAARWQSKQSIDYKGAGEIAAIADVGLWIQKGEKEFDSITGKDERTIVIRKVRHGIPGKFLVNILFPSGRVMDISDTEMIRTAFDEHEESVVIDDQIIDQV